MNYVCSEHGVVESVSGIQGAGQCPDCGRTLDQPPGGDPDADRERYERKPLPDLAAEFTEAGLCSLLKCVLKNRARYLVCYQVLDMWSSQLGATKFVAVGEGCTFASLDVAWGQKLDMELASTIKFPVWYVEFGATHEQRTATARELIGRAGMIYARGIHGVPDNSEERLRLARAFSPTGDWKRYIQDTPSLRTLIPKLEEG